jgi:CHAT domain-containing protein/tetratricopeptide (TPR) repeat protein
MNPILKKAFVITLLCLSGLLGAIQPVKGQSSLHDSLRHLLTYFQNSTKEEKLKQAIKEAQALYTSDRVDDSLAKKLLDVSDLLADGSQPNQSKLFSYAQTLVLILEKLPPQKEHPSYATSLNKLGALYNNMGQYDKAWPLFQLALTIYKQVLTEEHPDYVNNLCDLAFLYQNMGQYDKALPLYLEVLVIDKKVLSEKHADYATDVNNLAVLYRDMGQYDKALPLLQKSLAICKQVFTEDHPNYATSLNNLAVLYYNMGQYDKALPLYLQALAIQKKLLTQKHPNYALSLNNLAVLYHYMGQYDKALPSYLQVLAIRKELLTEDHPDYAISLNNLAQLYRDLGQYDKALPLYLQALAIQKKLLTEKHPNYALSLNNLAALHCSMGQYDKALPMCLQALVIRKELLTEDHPDYAISLTNLAMIYNNLSNPSAASPLLIQACNIKLNHLNRTYTTLSEQEKMLLLNKEALQFSYLPSFLVTNKCAEQPTLIQQVYANELALKGMVLESQQTMLHSIRKSSDSSALYLYEQWRFNKSFLGKQLLLPLAKRVPYLDSLQEATVNLEQQLARSSTAFYSQLQNQNLSSKDISQKLLQGQAAVEFIRFPLHSNGKWTDSTMYAALVLLSQDSVARFVPLFEEKQLQRLLKHSATAANNLLAVKRLYSHKGKGFTDSLYQLVWQPLEPYLQGIHTIYYAPAGLLHRIAFLALQADSAHSLIDKYQLNQLLSTRSVVVPVQLSKRPQNATIWGNIEYTASSGTGNSIAASERTRGQNSTDITFSAFDFYNEDTRGVRGQGWEPLPETKKEMESLKRVFAEAGIAVNAVSGTMASEEAFKALDGNSPLVLHLATHGFFLPVKEKEGKRNDLSAGGNTFTMQQNPLFRSGLVLVGGNSAWKGDSVLARKEDGILTAYEIAQMDLSNTDLVVLSACETALGDLAGNEGVIGLQRAFKLAGVKQMILSLWKVSDKATMELMTLFYRNWLGGKPTREALRSAQLQLKEKYKDPFFWAAFTLVE